MSTAKQQLLKIAEDWPKSHLDAYITNLEGQVDEFKTLIHELKAIQKRKQKEIDRKLRDSGPRGAT